MEHKTINDLHANPQNPRTLSKHDGAALKKSMEEFGDLSSIVFNVETKQLVGGHQRISIIKSLSGNKNIQITQQFDPATSDGTTAIGYITIGSKAFPYREVQWPLERELAANIAANKISGEFDKDLLAEVTYQLQQEAPDLLELTGQTEKEINDLLKHCGAVDEEQSSEDEESDDSKLIFKITKNQKNIITSVLENIKSTKNIAISSDEDITNGNALYYLCSQYQPEPVIVENFTPQPLPKE